MQVIVPAAAPTSATFTRASTATYINEAGEVMTSAVDQPRYQDGRLLIEGAATNLLLQSGVLSNSSWGKANCTVAAGGTPPDSSGAACTVTRSATGNHYLFQQYATTSHANTAYTFSVWIKAGTMTGNVALVIKDGGGTALVSSTVTPTGSWVRYSVTGTFGASPAANIGCFIDPLNDTGVAGDTFFAWGAQLETGSAATSYIATTTATASRSADSLSGQYLASYAATAVGLPIQVLDEDPSAAWVSGTTYAVGASVHRVTTHRVYRRAVAGAGTTAPEADTVNWQDIRATRRWAPLALAEDTKAVAIGNLYFTLVTNQAGVGLLLAGIRAATVRVVAQVPPFTSAVFDQTYTMPPQSTTYSVGNEPVLAVGLPSTLPLGSQIHITLIGTGSPSSSWLRYLAAGKAYALGGALQGSRVGIADYSRKETDEFGTTTLVQRAYAKRLNLELILANSEVQSAFALLADLRATPAMWVPADGSELSWLATYGWVRDWGITVAYTRSSLCTLEIEGLI